MIHPEQFQVGMRALQMLSGDCNLTQYCSSRDEVFENWASPFSALSIISNRETPIHRDTSGRFEWFDILVTLGNYEHAVLDLPGIGLALDYPPGSLVAIAGKVLLHGVEKVAGDRVCVAWYMRDRVHHQLGLPPCNWQQLNMLL